MLRSEIGRLAGLSRLKHGSTTRECGRIQIVSEIEAHRPHRCLITHPYPDGVRDVAVVAPGRSGQLQAQFRVFLTPPQQVVEQVVPVSKYVPRIVENDETYVVLKKRQSWRGHAQFNVVHK